MNNNDVAEISTLLIKDLGLSSTELINHETIDELKIKLTQIVTYLLDKDFEKLLHTMYRIDINENKLKIALASNPPDLIASKVATLILERELLKIKTRKAYKY